MSGHSKWASIKHKKAGNDAKRGKLFSKLIREITIASRLGGEIIDHNSRLKLAVMKARNANMPSKNIEAAIKKGGGTNESETYEEILYEAYGPEGVALLIQCLTDNRKRTVSEVRSVLSKNGGSMGETGSVAWQFEKKGVIHIERKAAKSEDVMMEIALKAGAEDMESDEEGFIVKGAPSELHRILEGIQEHQVEAANSEISMIPKTTVSLSPKRGEKIQTLIEKLEDLDDVQWVSSNESITS